MKKRLLSLLLVLTMVLTLFPAIGNTASAATEVTITANSAAKFYDGTPLKDSGFTITSGALINDDDKLFVTITDSQTEVGSSPNTISDVKVMRSGVDVTDKYQITKVDGTLTVKPFEYLTFTADSGFKVKLGKSGAIAEPSLQYSTDKENWSKLDIQNGASAGKNADNQYVIYLRNGKNEGEYTTNKAFSSSDTTYYSFVFTDKDGKADAVPAIAASGNIMTLLDYKNPNAGMNKWAFANLFSGCTTLTEAPELPATELAEYCYSGMFKGCTSLELMPTISATSLADYCFKEMFANCVNLYVANKRISNMGITVAWTIPAFDTATAPTSDMFVGAATLVNDGNEIDSTPSAGTYYAKRILDEVEYIDANGDTQKIGGATGPAYTIINASSANAVTWDAGWYVVDGGTAETPLTITGGATVSGAVHLILLDGSALSITGADSKAGITVSGTGNSLAIYGQTAGTGSLTATGGKWGAGIGGGSGGSGSNITINGGTVTATGGGGGAGIGGGRVEKSPCCGENITINGGKVIAEGGNNAAGIGGGQRGIGGTVTINGGTVNATGGSGSGGAGTGGAGIGGGSDGSGNTIEVNAGTVTAAGGSGAAGIGGGSNGSGSNIEVNAGTVTAAGGSGAAGIGGGSNGSGSNITINGGKVIAEGGSYGAGIGGGNGGTGSIITINGGTDLIVKAGDAANPTGEVAHPASTTDIASLLVGKRYVTITKPTTYTVTCEGTDTTENSLKKALANVKAGDTIKLGGDIVLTGTLFVSTGRNFTLDLNGHVLNSDKEIPIISNSGTLTIIDSSEKGGGKITGGKGSQGCGIYNDEYGKLNITGCEISGNTATSDGGGVYNGGIMTITDCKIIDNSATSGGGIFNNGTLTISGGSITGNEATYGGGIFNNFNASTITSATISGNIASSQGGGICTTKNITVTNSAITGNTANADNGTAIAARESVTVTLINCTIAGNSTEHSSLHFGDSATAYLKNCIVMQDGSVSAVTDDSATVNAYNTLSTYTEWNNKPEDNNGNLVYDSENPLFADAANGDYHLANDSQAYNVGNDTYFTDAASAKDIDGYKRVMYDKIDLGAYEYQYTITPYTDTFDGLSHNAVSISTLEQGATVSYIRDGAPMNNVPTFLSAGEYIIYVTIKRAGYKDYTQKVTCNIERATVKITDLDAGDKEYNATTSATVTYTATGIIPGTEANVTYTADFEDKNVGEDKEVSIKLEIVGQDRSDYKIDVKDKTYTPETDKPYIVTTSDTADICKADLTVSGTTVDDSKIYDGNTSATVNMKGTLEDVKGSDDVSIDTATGTFGDKNVGEDKEVTVTYTLKGADAGNYTVKNGSTTADITPKELNVTGTTAANKTYDGFTTATVTAGTPKAADIISGDDVSISSATGTFDDKNVGTDKTVTVTYTLTGADKDNYSAKGNCTLSITKRDVTLTSDDGTKKYDGKLLTNKSVTVSGSGFVAGEGATYDFTGSQTAVGSSPNSFTYTLNAGTSSINYSITKVEGTLDVTPNDTAITITANSKTKTYDGTALTDGGYTYTGSLAAGDTFASVTVTGSITDFGTAANKVTDWVIQNEAGDDVNDYYTNIKTADGTLSITKRDVTLTSDSAEREYDGTPLTAKTVNITGEGFISGQGITVTDYASITGAGEAPNAFVYSLNLDTQATNYEWTIVEGTLKVTPLRSDDTGAAIETLPSEVKTALESKIDAAAAAASQGLETALGFNGNGIEAAASESIANVLGNTGFVQVLMKGVGFDAKADKLNVDSEIITVRFDVTPYNSEGEAQTTLDEPVTFRVPLISSDCPFVHVYHKGQFIRQITINSNTKFIEITSDSFSEYSYTLTNVNLYIITNPEYAVTVEEAQNGTVTADLDKAVYGKTVTLTVEAEKGYTPETITVTANDKEIELTAMEDGTYTFKMPSAKVTVSASFMEDNTMLNYFFDVKATDYFYEAVLWAAENGITNGLEPNYFTPNGLTTRAQMVTFLWRAAGEPVVNYAMPFTDVDEDDYYAEAVRWAASEGIVKGTTDTTFEPYANVNRAQAVTFLWRYAGALQFANMTAYGPAPSPFEDVETNAYYYNAVLWAVAEGITNGVNDEKTLFAPNDTCIRAQTVTFLYRHFVKEDQ